MKSGGDYANALRKISSIIGKFENNFDKGQIETIAQYCHGLDNSQDQWSYYLKDFYFPKKTFKDAKLDKVHPNKAKEFRVILSVKLSGKFTGKISNEEDPLIDLSVNVVVTDFSGEFPDNIFCAWHMDSHPPEGVDEDEKDDEGNRKHKPSPFAHPRYHWQYGGKKIWDAQDAKTDKEEFYGSHLLLESPRLAHPPLDAILAIDFILANYYSTTWRAARLDTEYIRVVKEAQKNYWYSYFKSIANNINTINSDEYSVKIMPHFFPEPDLAYSRK